MRPERALRWLDSLDAFAGALRLVCAGYAGSRLLAVLFAILITVLAWRWLPA